MAATGRINKYIKAAVEQRIRWREACKVAGPRDWCLCVPLFSQASVNSLFGFAPPGVEVELPERSPEDLAFFCSQCGKPRNPVYVDGIWPAGMRERLTGEQLEEELEAAVAVEDEPPGVVSPFSTNGNGYHQVKESEPPKPASRVNDDEDKGDGNDWAL